MTSINEKIGKNQNVSIISKKLIDVKSFGNTAHDLGHLWFHFYHFIDVYETPTFLTLEFKSFGTYSTYFLKSTRTSCNKSFSVINRVIIGPFV